jgi:hypothetical protein
MLYEPIENTSNRSTSDRSSLETFFLAPCTPRKFIPGKAACSRITHTKTPLRHLGNTHGTQRKTKVQPSKRPTELVDGVHVTQDVVSRAHWTHIAGLHTTD